MAGLALLSLLEARGLSWICYAVVSNRDWTQSHGLAGQGLELPQRDSSTASKQWVFDGGAEF